MNRRTFFAAVAFLSALILFALPPSPFFALSEVSPVHAQGAALTFDSTADFTRLVRPGGLIGDVKGIWRQATLPEGLERWQL